jgi:hypothetical protein
VPTAYPQLARVNVNHMAEAVLVTGARVAIAHGEQEQAENDAFDVLAWVMRIEAHQPAPGSLHRRFRGRDSFIGVGAMRI